MNKKKTILHGLTLLSPFFLCLCSTGGVEKAELPSTDGKYVGTIRNDTVWKDTNGNEIWCNGGHMIREGDTFYWVGYETKPQMGYRNIKLYSSTNLADWKFENNILRRERSYTTASKGVICRLPSPERNRER